MSQKVTCIKYAGKNSCKVSIFEGPYPGHSVKGPNTYMIQFGTKAEDIRKYNVNSIVPYCDRDDLIINPSLEVLENGQSETD